METGMMWYDDSPARSLGDKLTRAVEYYRAKYGGAPNTCYVHPSCMPDQEGVPQECPQGLRLVRAHDVLPHHFWLGIWDTAGANKAD